ncbi:MAG: hypothetical protein AAFY73_11085 [Pseudomonadota bacterium]
MGRFVGIGFGAIQAGLFVREASRSGAFESITIAARRADLVEAVNRDGRFQINVAQTDRIVSETINGVRALLLGPNDRDALIEALTDATEIAVAVSSVADYRDQGPYGLDQLLAGAVLRKAGGHGPKALIYAAENHHEAARLLEHAIVDAALKIDPDVDVSSHFQTVDTVIGKMSRIVSDPDELEPLGVAEMTPGSGRAFLVEAFNRIQISEVDPERTSGRGIDVFEEKDDLHPFEDAKLHGHNATHALLAYLGTLAGHQWMADVLQDQRIAPMARDAFLNESGAALRAKHQGQDWLFTIDGYRAYVDDLIGRIGNPFLRDTCERIGRDIERKLGWDDRLIGTVRVCLDQGVESSRYAIAALAAHQLWRGHVREFASMQALWLGQGADEAAAAPVLDLLNSQKAAFQTLLADLAAEPAA